MKQKYYISILHGDRVREELVDGEPITVEGFGDFEFFRHQRNGAGEWSISEARTGALVSGGRTGEEALANFHQLMAGRKPEEVKRFADSFIALYGERPRWVATAKEDEL